MSLRELAVVPSLLPEVVEYPLPADWLAPPGAPGDSAWAAFCAAVGEGPRGGPVRHVCVVTQTARDHAFLFSALGGGTYDRTIRAEQRCVAALRSLVQEPVDLLIAGLSLPDWDGHDLAVAASRLGVARRVVLCADRTAERDLELLHARRDAGGWIASVHLDRDAPALLAETFHTALSGGQRSPAAVKLEWQRRVFGEDSYTHRLTAAQTRMLAYAGSGLDDKEISAELGVSVHTARAHRKAVMRKLNLHSHPALIAYAVRRGLVRFVEDRVLRPGFDVERLLADAGCAPPTAEPIAPVSRGAGLGPVIYPARRA